jgi:hypothetical protein
MSAQSVLPTYFDKVMDGPANSIITRLNFDEAFDGGSSLTLIFQNNDVQIIPQQSLEHTTPKLPSLRLFKTNFVLESDFVVSYTLLSKAVEKELALVLRCIDEYSIFLIPQSHRHDFSEKSSRVLKEDKGMVVFSNDRTTHKNGWETRTFLIPKPDQLLTTKIVAIDILQFQSLVQIKEFLVEKRRQHSLQEHNFALTTSPSTTMYLIGQLKVLENVPIELPIVDNLRYEIHWNADSLLNNNKIVDIIVYWTCHGSALHFNIFLDKQFIGRAYTSYYIIEHFIVESTAVKEYALTVQAVNLAGMKENNFQKLPTIILSFER